MSGLVKAKKYDWKDSNLAMFGSDTEKQVKKESAESEPAWRNAGTEVGLQIWRIVKFEITHWDKKDYGKFYSGDSYIILNTYKEKDSKELLYDVHFWIGKESTQDEYGTAAYKTVELDTFLNDKPIQHREVQAHESDLFKSYFKELTYMRGGADTGFRKVKPEEYKPRLLLFKGTKKQVTISEIPLCKSRVKSEDVFILDLGQKLYQFNGADSSKDERYKAVQYMGNLKSERCGKAEAETLDEGDVPPEHEFWTSLTEDDDDDDDGDEQEELEHKLYRLSDVGGELSFDLKTTGQSIKENEFVSDDVFILDTVKELFVWVGRRASKKEKKNAMTYAHQYLMTTSHKLIPVSCFCQGKEPREFKTALAA